MSYKSTAVQWAQYMRELFMEYFQRNLKNKVLNGTIEIDESVFGRRVKHNRGGPNALLKIWIFGMVERESNTLIIYPVADNSAETLIPLILRHVQKGSTIFSDGLSAYCDLNEHGYQHFTVIHKYAFRKTYVNQISKEEVIVHTNNIEGCWKHAKDHFKRMSGTKIGQFESHLAEVMWRAQVKGDFYSEFFHLVKSTYCMEGQAEFTYSKPLFDSWPGSGSGTPTSDWEIMPGDTDAESDSDADERVGQKKNPILVLSDASKATDSESPFFCGRF